MSKILTLHLSRLYFDQINSGSKLLEFRLYNPYWQARIEGQAYDEIELVCGYPKKDDRTKRIRRPWVGYAVVWIQHELFKMKRRKVFAIRVN